MSLQSIPRFCINVSVLGPVALPEHYTWGRGGGAVGGGKCHALPTKKMNRIKYRHEVLINGGRYHRVGRVPLGPEGVLVRVQVHRNAEVYGICVLIWG